MKIPSFETALSRMKMITVPEWERYANHSCADYVAQGKTFTYNKLDRLKDMNFNHLDKEIPNSQSSAQASVETDTNSDNVVQGNDSDDFVDFVNNSDAAAMNGEGEDGSLLDQSIQEESPTLSSGGTQTEKASNLATFGTQTNKNTNMISGEAQTDIQTPIRSIQTDTRGLMSNASVDTGSRNPMRSIETQTRGLMSDASAQTGSRNPMKSIETQTIGSMTDASIQASSEGYNCPTCGKRLSTKYALNRHRREVHKESVETAAQKKIKKMQMMNQNCKTPPPPPLTKGPSNLLKPHRPTKTMKAFVKIKKLPPSHPPPSPTKGPSNLLKPHRPTKSPRKKLSPPPPPPPKNLNQNLKRGHDLFEKDSEDVISLKKRIKSPGKGKQTAGKKRNRKAAFLNLDEEEDEEFPKRTRRQTRSAARDQEDTRNFNQANFQGGF